MSETEREDFLVEKVTGGIRTLAEKLDKLVIVSNNVFEDGISYDAQTMSYIRVLGRVNQELDGRSCDGSNRGNSGKSEIRQ